jgi:hypothetical protein
MKRSRLVLLAGLSGDDELGAFRLLSPGRVRGALAVK